MVRLKLASVWKVEFQRTLALVGRMAYLQTEPKPLLTSMITALRVNVCVIKVTARHPPGTES